MVPGRCNRKPQLALCVGEPPGKMWRRADRAIFTCANRQRSYFRFIVNFENQPKMVLSSLKTGDAQNRLFRMDFRSASPAFQQADLYDNCTIDRLV